MSIGLAWLVAGSVELLEILTLDRRRSDFSSVGRWIQIFLVVVFLLNAVLNLWMPRRDRRRVGTWRAQEPSDHSRECLLRATALSRTALCERLIGPLDQSRIRGYPC
jgi:hypothetical protein